MTTTLVGCWRARIRRQLLAAPAARAFVAMDVNRDGRLDGCELYAAVLLLYLKMAPFVAVAPPPREHMMALLADLDGDHDGKLDATEFEAFVVWLTAGLLARAALQLTVMLVLGPLLAARLLSAGGDGAFGDDGIAAAEAWLARWLGQVYVPRGSLTAMLAVATAALLTPLVLRAVDAALLTAAEHRHGHRQQ